MFYNVASLLRPPWSVEAVGQEMVKNKRNEAASKMKVTMQSNKQNRAVIVTISTGRTGGAHRQALSKVYVKANAVGLAWLRNQTAQACRPLCTTAPCHHVGGPCPVVL